MPQKQYFLSSIYLVDTTSSLRHDMPKNLIQETPKVPPLNMPSRRIWITYAHCQAWYFLLAPLC